MKIRPHIGAALATGLAHEQSFDVGEPDIVRSLIGTGALMIPILSGVAIHA
jgi:hypothetical protein